MCGDAAHTPLVPAQAGTQSQEYWIPAFAGMSGDWCCDFAQETEPT